MKNILFIFVFFFLLIFACVFGYSSIRYYQAIHFDDPIKPYLFVEKGRAVIVRKDLAIEMKADERYNVRAGDVINVSGNSVAILYWPDRSVTRLDADTKFVIGEMYAAVDYATIRFSGKLERGKIWSNMIRTLYPGSEITIALPNGVVAGVRGTIFSIDLDDQYIHAVEHVVTVKNPLFQSRSIFPGEAVSTVDIFKNVSLQMIDHTWEEWNTLKDGIYEQLRNSEVNAAWKRLTGTVSEKNWWDWFMRKVLSSFGPFRDIVFAEKIKTLDVDSFASIPQEVLFEWYQKVKSSDLLGVRDALRGRLMNISEQKGLDEYISVLTLESLWDKAKFPTVPLEYTDKFLAEYGKKMNIDMQSVIKSFAQEDYTDVLQKKFQTILGF